uniref:Uncharacterized protein LOC114326189 n=1 Tax=Diabrotica virgifera virgifera TaxID=50390 RepID=A0A6P7F3K4_DIAVI
MLSIFSAELIAIKLGISMCLEQEDDTFVIFTDSKSSVENLKNICLNPNLNYILLDILELYHNVLSRGKQIYISWIKAHSGIDENEVNSLAKNDAKNGRILGSKIPESDFIPIFRKELKENWQLKYELGEKGQFFKNIQPKIRDKPWFENIICNRLIIRIISRMRCNHALFAVYKCKIGLLDNNKCLCDEIADLQPILLECRLKKLEIDKLYQN